MKYRIFNDRVKLYGSCFVPKDDFRSELGRIRNLHPDCLLWKRSEGSLVREWAAHNWACSFGIKPEKTTDVDLEFEPKWYVSVLYFVVGSLAFLFIK